MQTDDDNGPCPFLTRAQRLILIDQSVSRFIRIKWGRFDMRVQRLVCGNPGGITIFYSRRADFKVKAGIQIFWEDVMHHLGNKQVISYYTF